MSDRQYHMIPNHAVLTQVSILAEALDYNHEMMNVPEMWQTTRGQNVKLAVLDTGVPNHTDIRPITGHSVIPGYKEDRNGHATHCAGIIAALANNGMGVAGIAPDVEDGYCAVLDGTGNGTLKQIVAGIHWAVDEFHADIISLSLGIPGSFDIGPELEQACNYAAEHGVAVFAAAGNDGGRVSHPARYDSVIAVAAVDSQKNHADFSNSGPQIDFAAGGVNVYSTYLGNSYAKLSGTSMACPAIAAIGALILAKHRTDGEDLLPAELKAHIRKIAFDVGTDGFDDLYGHGIPIFGKSDDTPIPVEPAKPEPTPPDTGAKKKGPRANCAYWKLWHNFTQAVGSALEANDNVSLEGALKQGFKSLSKDTRAVSYLMHTAEVDESERYTSVLQMLSVCAPRVLEAQMAPLTEEEQVLLEGVIRNRLDLYQQTQAEKC